MVPTKIDSGVVWVYLMGRVTSLLIGGSGRGRGEGPLWNVGKMLTVLL